MQHITVNRKGGEIPRPVRIHENHFKCPFCSPELYKPAGYPKIATHLASHKLKTISHRDYIIYGCGLGCGGKAKHFHCCYCSKTYIKKIEILKHLDLHCPDSPCQPSAATPGPSTPVPPAEPTPGPSTPVPQAEPTPGPSTPVPQAEPTPGPSTPVPQAEPTPGPSTSVPPAVPAPGPSTSVPPAVPAPGPSMSVPPAVPAPGPSTPIPPAVPTPGPSTPVPSAVPTPDPSTPVPPAVPTPGPSKPIPPAVPTPGPSTSVPPAVPTPGPSTPVPSAVPTPGPSTPVPPAVPTPGPSEAPSNTLGACREPQSQHTEQNLNKDSTEGVVTRNKISVQCPHCNLTVNKRNLKKHIMRRHVQSHAEDITTTHPLKVQCFDRTNGIYAAAKSFRGPPAPVHVSKKTG